ncbi:MAG TPA: nuclease [Actinobacteria bacterium]|nr:nuclease [Actinomycetota bacterium]
MAPRSIPESVTSPASERVVWEHLMKHLPDEAVVIHGQRIRDNRGDCEADFLVLIPHRGFVAIEVKGGEVSYENGRWWQQTAEGGKREVYPNEQALRAKYAMQDYLDRRTDVWTKGRVRKAHLMVLPRTAWGPQLEAPEPAPEFIVSSDRLNAIADMLLHVLDNPGADEGFPVPDEDAVEQATDALAGRLDQQRTIDTQRQLLDEHVDRVTMEQAKILNAYRGNPRIEVIGGPGSGKSWLALQMTKDLAKDGKSVALLCYSKGLVTWFQRQIKAWPEQMARRVDARTYHALGVSWGLQIPEGAGSDQVWWESEAPGLMLPLAQGLGDEQKFDAVLVDEAQDFADSWWPPLINALRDSDRGQFHIFGDQRQGVFGRSGRPDLSFATMHLTSNVRNTKQIAKVLKPFREDAVEARGGVGLPVRFVQCTPQQAHDTADTIAVKLLEEGWKQRDIAVLTTHHRHSQQIRLADGLQGRDGFWETFWERDDVFYCTVTGFKGLERPAVVLAVDGFLHQETARDILYVGLSRGRDQLIVCGDLDQIGEVGGQELRRRLKRAQEG